MVTNTEAMATVDKVRRATRHPNTLSLCDYVVRLLAEVATLQALLADARSTRPSTPKPRKRAEYMRQYRASRKPT